MAARVGGRNLAMSWVVGILCSAVVVALIWFAIPMVPVLAEFAGTVLRQIAP